MNSHILRMLESTHWFSAALIELQINRAFRRSNAIVKLSDRMFLLMLLISAATAASVKEHTFYNIHTLEDIADFVLKKTGLNGNLAVELAALKDTVINQGLEITSLKEEVTLLQETIHEQGLQIISVNEENINIKRNAQGQEKQIMKMNKAITKMKETLAHKETYDQHISTIEEELASLIDATTVAHDKFLEQMGNDLFLPEIDQANKQIQIPLHQATEIELIKKPKHNKHQQIVQSVLSSISNKNEHSKNNANTQKVNSYISGVQKRATGTGGIAFSAYLGSVVNHVMTGNTVKCDQILLNDGNAYNGHTGIFTVPETGVYLLTFTITTDYLDHWIVVQMKVDGRLLVEASIDSKYSKHSEMGSNTVIVRLNRGDSVWLEITDCNDGKLFGGTRRDTTFSGVFLY